MEGCDRVIAIDDCFFQQATEVDDDLCIYSRPRPPLSFWKHQLRSFGNNNRGPTSANEAHERFTSTTLPALPRILLTTHQPAEPRTKRFDDRELNCYIIISMPDLQR
jgi:hypothetical protein